MREYSPVARVRAARLSAARRLLALVRRARRGSVSTVIAAVTPVLIGIMGLAIDTTYWETSKVSLQGAADQAAVAAGRAYRSDSNVSTEAVSMLAAHGYVGGAAGVSVAVSHPAVTGPFAGNPQSIEVVVSQPQRTYFAGALGISAPTVSARSVAAPATSGGGACIIALATTGTAISMNGTNTVDISHCNVYNNSTANNATSLVGGASLTALNAYLASIQAPPAGLVVTRTLQTGASPVADPYATRAIPAVPARCDATNASYSGSVAFAAKADGMFVFCNGLKLTGSGNTLSFGPGIYIIDRGTFSINGGWTINGTGVSVFFSSSTGSGYADLKVNANQIINITAPTTGIAKGIAWWINRNAASSTLSFGGGSTLNIVGAIYGANTDVTVSGNNGSAKCTQVVAKTITFNGNNTFKHDCAGVGISDPPGSLPALVLVQ